MTTRHLTLATCHLTLALSLSLSAATNYVSLTGNHTPPFDTWAKAATNIQAAVDAAGDGDTVLVTNGVYATGAGMAYGSPNRVAVTKAVSVHSVNGPEVTSILGAPDPTSGAMGDSALRCAYLTNGAELVGFTLSNGFSRRWGNWYQLYGGGVMLDRGGTVSNCVIAGNVALDGGGVFTYQDGLVVDCVICGNLAGWAGGGARCDSGGTIRTCRIIGNSARIGGGTYYGTIENCFIAGNQAQSHGGGTYYGTINNCTIVDNTAWLSGGGVYRSTVRNSIVYYNKSYTEADNYYLSSGSLRYSCTTPLPSGSGNITNLPVLLSLANPHIASNSPCINAGNNGYASGPIDIDGEPRITGGTVDIGCDEFLAAGITGVLGVAVVAEAAGALIDMPVSFKAEIAGKADVCAWDLGDGRLATNVPVIAVSYPVTGHYQVVLAAWNNDRVVAATVTLHVVEGFTNYVSLAGSNVVPFQNWADAATSIQDAIDAAYIGGVVLVADGSYQQGGFVSHDSRNRVGVAKHLTVTATNGNPTRTCIVGVGPMGVNAVRCAYVGDGAMLCGFTLTNGHTAPAEGTVGGGYFQQSGGGAWCEPGGCISNCLVRGNNAWDYGGGVMGGTVECCDVSDNETYSYGGGTAYANVEQSSISRNYSGRDGGGTYEGTATRCIIAGNMTSGGGGGAGHSILRNCLVSGNTAYSGGAADWSTVLNCTVVGNSAGNQAGGLYNGYVANSIVYYNHADGSDQNYRGNNLTNCCTTPEPAGPGNITNAPGILALDNPHILAGSPCIDAGTNAYAAVPMDIDGEQRMFGPAVDIGCDEFISAGITGELRAMISANYTNLIVGGTVEMESSIRGKANGLEWLLWTGERLTNAVSYVYMFTMTGQFPVILAAWNNERASAATVTVSVVAGFTNYASLSGSHVSPFTSWATAATTLQYAVDVAYAGGTVLVAPGTYAVGSYTKYGARNRVGIDKPLTVQGADSSPGAAIIAGAGPLGDTAVRCAYLGDGARLAGLTLSNGCTKTVGDWELVGSGGGAWCEGKCEISNCVVIGCNAAARGGGLYANSSVVDRCTIEYNDAEEGGGLLCADGSFVNRCVIQSNTAGYAAGAYCWSDCHIMNSLIVNNRARMGLEGSAVGGIGGGIVQNCTIAGNSARDRVGGASYCDLWNCIVYSNMAPEDPNSSGCTFLYSCTTPLPAGEGNISNDPVFVAGGQGDYHLATTSPCVDAGTNLPWMATGMDLDGLPRIHDGVVDMGCYEWIPEPGSGVAALAFAIVMVIRARRALS